MATFFERERPRLGAIPEGDGTRFRVWTPFFDEVALVLHDETDTSLPLEHTGHNLFEVHVDGVGHGSRYRYRLDDTHLFPDPASRYQPDGVHGPSMVVDPARYSWKDDAWEGIEQKDLIFYELHVGTFSPEGSFDGVRERLEHLRELGVTAIELMPVADFPGRWNWGYDHAALYAPSHAYGTPDDLRRLVDAAHQHGLAVYLDVIHNHLGPDGAYAAAYAPFLTNKYKTPWGYAINLDGKHAEGVRHFFIDNALYWLREFHIDGFRLDAVHALHDASATHFLEEFASAVHSFPYGPPRRVIAEDHNNINTLVLPPSEGGHGLDGTWTDDFHHQIRTFTTGTRGGIFKDFEGTTIEDLAEGLQNGWFYDGRRPRSRSNPRGTDPSTVRPEQIVIYIQNHDQVGNRPHGERLNHEVSPALYRAISAILLFSHQTPLLFMGQEWAASSPFQFFTDHHQELGEKVRRGRRQEQRQTAGFEGPGPDPQDRMTFERSRLDWTDLEQPEHQRMLALYQELLRTRRLLEGSLHATAHGETGLLLERAAHLLVAALDTDVRIPVPAEAQLVWHTEEESFAVNGEAPKRHGDHVYFPASAAVLFETKGYRD